MALGNRSAGSEERRLRDQRHVAKGDQDILEANLNGRAGRQHGVGRSEPLGLQEALDGEAWRRRCLCYPFGIAAKDERDVPHSGARDRIHDMRNDGAARNRVQHLGHGRFHTGTVAGSQDDRKAATVLHVGSSIRRRSMFWRSYAGLI